MTLPTFVGLGAKKCGTTWLFDQLSAHPDVYFPDTKEVRFFDLNWDLGRRHYEGLYAAGSTTAARGDITPSYLQREPAAERMHSLIPDARLVVMLRHPVERAISHYVHVMRPTPDEVDVDRYFVSLESRGHNAVRWSFYADALHRFIDLFGRDALHVVRFEDVRREPASVLDAVAQHIGVEPIAWPLDGPSNAAAGFKSAAVAAAYERVAVALHRSGLDRVRRWVRRTGLPARVAAWNARSINKPRLSAALYDELLSLYAADVWEVEALTGWDLDAWRQPGPSVAE